MYVHTLVLQTNYLLSFKSIPIVLNLPIHNSILNLDLFFFLFSLQLKILFHASLFRIFIKDYYIFFFFFKL